MDGCYKGKLPAELSPISRLQEQDSYTFTYADQKSMS